MTTLLVDGPNILMRSVHAAHGAQMSANGVSTGALHLFIQLLSKYVRQTSPTHMAVFWDAGHAFRDAAYPAYKANRKTAVEGSEDMFFFAQAKEFLTWAGVPHKAHTGYEADDLIAATARQSVVMDDVVILSGDKDLLQLVQINNNWVRDYGTERGTHTVTQIRVPDDKPWDETMVEAKFGVLPHHLSHYLALVGDAGDGVPGVAGIGPKKALALLEKAEWDWDEVLGLLGEEKAAQAALMHTLVDLRTYPYDEVFMAAHAGAPLFRPTEPLDASLAWRTLQEFCGRYHLETARERLEAGTLWREPEGAADVFLGMDGP